ncbi:MAG TPA: lamin tail domain-containing protein [Thermoanaerobaculia bacterium]|nr:lamin tail domain-containing protein [Thermoanaerobaculia bacterium]
MNVSSSRRLTLGLVFLLAFLVLTPVAGAVSPNVVISQVYGGGGNSGATLRNDFIELFNRGTTTVSVATWSVQYASSAGSSWQRTNLTGSIAPGQYYLVQQAAGAGGSVNLPAPDATGAIPMSATSGKVALVNNQTTLTCGAAGFNCLPNAAIVDFVGYGSSATNFEGTGPTATLSNTAAALRAAGGCTDTDNNASDFATGAPNPRNSATTFNVCSGPGVPTNPSGVGASTPSAVDPGDSSLLTVTVTAGSNPTSTGMTVTGNLTSIGGPAAQPFFNDGSNGDVTAGDNVHSYLATVAPGTTSGSKSLPATINDAQARSGSASIPISIRALVEIFQIQGAGLASPYAGQPIRTNDNIVTGVAPNGFFIQTPTGRADANVETSNGVFVFTSSAPTVTVGAQVDVTATVSEFFNMTELDSPGVSIDSNGNPLPAAVLLGATTPSPNQPQPANEMERYEGMVVRVENGVATGPSNQFDEVSIVASSTRTFREPGILYPGLPSLPVWDGNPEIFEIEPSGLGLPNVAIPGGAVITLVEGPLAFSFGDYQIWPSTLDVVGTAAVVPVRDRNAGEFTVGTQNVLRLFDLVNDPNTSDETPTPAEYAARLNKFSLLIRNALKAPDVLTVQEAENLTVLQDLAAKIAADDPSIVYTPYLLEGNDIGGIDNGFLVRDTVDVDSVEQFGKDDLFTLDGSKLNDRPPLVLRGSYVGGTVPFPIVVIGVHQRSLSGIEGTSAGANRVRQKRNEQAVKLSQYLQGLQEADADIRLTVAGDFNSFEFTDGYVDVMGQVTGNPDPAGALIPPTDVVNPNLTNQTFNLPAGERYSFVFDGSAQSLDHAVTSSGMDFWVRGVQHARGNSDAPFSFENDGTTALRASDHDGTVVFVMGDNDGDGFPDDGDTCVASSTSATVVIDGCNSGAGNDLFSNGCKISDQIAACAASAVTHEDFTGCVAHATNVLFQNGVITAKERGAIQKCAGKADIP